MDLQLLLYRLKFITGVMQYLYLLQNELANSALDRSSPVRFLVRRVIMQVVLEKVAKPKGVSFSRNRPKRLQKS